MVPPHPLHNWKATEEKQTLSKVTVFQFACSSSSYSLTFTHINQTIQERQKVGGFTPQTKKQIK